MGKNENMKLTGAEEGELGIKALVQAIPWVGGPISVLYFDRKQERRFKRLEAFYNELKDELLAMKDQITSIDEQNKEALVAIIEIINEKVEAEPLQEKRQFFLNYFKNTLLYPITTNFDERKYFLDTLAAMTILECGILSSLFTISGFISIGDIERKNIDQYAIMGAINRLKSYGFLKSYQGTFDTSSDTVFKENVQVSTFGKEFHVFCLEV